MRAKFIGVAIAAAMTSIAQADDGAFRCGNSIVDHGDPADEVIEACGEPERSVTLENNYGATVGYRHWIDPGYGKDTRQVTYNEEGRITQILEVD